MDISTSQLEKAGDGNLQTKCLLQSVPTHLDLGKTESRVIPSAGGSAVTEAEPRGSMAPREQEFMLYYLKGCLKGLPRDERTHVLYSLGR